jgi:hypothetical protein
MPEQHEWVWQPPTYIRDTPEGINDWKQRFTDVWGKLGKGPSTVAGICFKLGLEQLEADPELAKQLDTNMLEMMKCYQESLRLQDDQKRLRTVLQNKYCGDGEKFTEYCLSKGVALEVVQKVVDEYRVEIPAWHKKTLTWLNDVVLEDGLPHATDEIHQRAIDDGIIPNGQSDWARLRQLAWRERLTTGEKGYWQKL